MSVIGITWPRKRPTANKRSICVTHTQNMLTRNSQVIWLVIWGVARRWAAVPALLATTRCEVYGTMWDQPGISITSCSQQAEGPGIHPH